jgi:hypothetical protein
VKPADCFERLLKPADSSEKKTSEGIQLNHRYRICIYELQALV